MFEHQSNLPKQRLSDQSYRAGVLPFPDSSVWEPHWQTAQRYGYALYLVGDRVIICNDQSDVFSFESFFRLVRFMGGLRDCDLQKLILELEGGQSAPTSGKNE